MPFSSKPSDPAQTASGGLSRPDPATLGDIDAWDLSEEGQFCSFTARLPGTGDARRYFRAISGGAIFAETSGPLRMILGIGGGRLTTSWGGPPGFPHHILSCPAPQPGEPDRIATALRSQTGESMLADALLAKRHAAWQGLPLCIAGQQLLPPGASAAERDAALAGLRGTYGRGQALARQLGRAARVLALRLDPGFDQAPQDAAQFHVLLLDLLDRIAAEFDSRTCGVLRYLLCFDCGGWWQNDAGANRPVLEGLHRLILRPGPHQVICPAPGYMFAQDLLGQPTQTAMQDRAEIEALALQTVLARKEWLCPLLCLAERSGKTIRATFRALGPLVADPADPFGAGPGLGFALAGTGARIKDVAIAPDDPAAVLIRVAGDLAPLPGANELRLDYATGAAARRQPMPHAAACGALRDSWSAPAPSGKTLHRWALPASLTLC